MYFRHWIATIGVFTEIWLLLTLNDDTLMDPLTSRITRILVDKGTFYTLISLNLVMLTWNYLAWSWLLSVIINCVSGIQYPCSNCVEVVRCVATNWCNKRQPPQSHYEMPPRDYVLGGNPRRAAANCAAAVCVVSGLRSSADVRVSALLRCSNCCCRILSWFPSWMLSVGRG